MIPVLSAAIILTERHKQIYIRSTNRHGPSDKHLICPAMGPQNGPQRKDHSIVGPLPSNVSVTTFPQQRFCSERTGKKTPPLPATATAVICNQYPVRLIFFASATFPQLRLDIHVPAATVLFRTDGKESTNFA
jgi:hypothetical protein